MWPEDLFAEAYDAHLSAHHKAPLVAGNLALGNAALDQQMLMHPWPTKGYYQFTIRYFLPDAEPDYDPNARAYLVASIHFPAGLTRYPTLLEVRRTEREGFDLYICDELVASHETLGSACLASLAIAYDHARTKFDQLVLQRDFMASRGGGVAAAGGSSRRRGSGAGRRRAARGGWPRHAAGAAAWPGAAGVPAAR
jgi:hypothetical protein